MNPKIFQYFLHFNLLEFNQYTYKSWKKYKKIKWIFFKDFSLIVDIPVLNELITLHRKIYSNSYFINLFIYNYSMKSMNFMIIELDLEETFIFNMIIV